MIRAWRGPGAAAHGPRVLPRKTKTVASSKGIGPWEGSKTGRRPLLGPLARLSRAFSQKV